MLASWLATHPGGTSSPEDALAWIQDQPIGDLLATVLLPVLERIWRAAWYAGVKAARTLTRSTADVSASVLNTLINQMAGTWLAQIVGTTLKLLANGLAAGADAAGLTAILQDLQRTKDIAQTEITRMMAYAAQQVYSATGNQYVRWIIEDANACTACKANAAAGRWPIGEAFPSGALAPPQHVRCRCGIVPA